MNDPQDITMHKDIVFRFLEQKLNERISRLEALRFSNDRTVDYIREKIDQFSQDLNVSDVYSPPAHNGSLADQLRGLFQDLKEGKLPLLKDHGAKDDDSDDINDPNYNPTTAGNSSRGTEPHSQNELLTLKKTLTEPHGQSKKTVSKTKTETHITEQPKTMVRSTSRTNIRPGHKPEENHTANRQHQKVHVTDKSNKSANPSRTSSPGKSAAHQKKLSKALSNSKDENDNISESGVSESDRGKIVRKKPEKVLLDSSKPIRPGRKIEHDKKKDDTDAKTDRVSTTGRSKVKNDADKRSISPSASTTSLHENGKRSIPNNSRSKTPTRVSTVKKTGKEESKKVETASGRGKSNDAASSKRLKPSASAKDLAEDNKKVKGKTQDGISTPSFSGVKETKFSDQKQSKAEKETEQPAVIKTDNLGVGTFRDPHILSFDVKDIDQQENLLASLDRIDEKLHFKEFKDELRAEEESLLRKRISPIQEAEASKEVGSPEKKIRHFSTTSSAKRKNLQLDIEQIERDAAEGWEPEMQENANEEDEHVNGGVYPNEGEVDPNEGEIDPNEEFDPNGEVDPNEGNDPNEEDDPNEAQSEQIKKTEEDDVNAEGNGQEEQLKENEQTGLKEHQDDAGKEDEEDVNGPDASAVKADDVNETGDVNKQSGDKEVNKMAENHDENPPKQEEVATFRNNNQEEEDDDVNGHLEMENVQENKGIELVEDQNANSEAQNEKIIPTEQSEEQKQQPDKTDEKPETQSNKEETHEEAPIQQSSPAQEDIKNHPEIKVEAENDINEQNHPETAEHSNIKEDENKSSNENQVQEPQLQAATDENNDPNTDVQKEQGEQPEENKISADPNSLQQGESTGADAEIANKDEDADINGPGLTTNQHSNDTHPQNQAGNPEDTTNIQDLQSNLVPKDETEVHSETKNQEIQESEHKSKEENEKTEDLPEQNNQEVDPNEAQDNQVRETITQEEPSIQQESSNQIVQEQAEEPEPATEHVKAVTKEDIPESNNHLEQIHQEAPSSNTEEEEPIKTETITEEPPKQISDDSTQIEKKEENKTEESDPNTSERLDSQGPAEAENEEAGHTEKKKVFVVPKFKSAKKPTIVRPGVKKAEQSDA